MLGGMRTIFILLLYYLLLALATPLQAADRELTLARDMLEDAIIRNDVEGTRLTRERLLRLTAEADDPMVLRDAHYLVALSVFFESAGGVRDLATLQSNALMGIRHADRAVQLDPKFADGWMMTALLRGNARRAGLTVPADPPGTPNRMAHAIELDPKSPGVAFFNAMFRSFNPAGAAPPAGVQAFEQLAAQLDADRAATGRRFGLWDAETHWWNIIVRNASGRTLLDMPLSAGLAGAFLLPFWAAVGSIVALAKEFTIVVERDPEHGMTKTQ